MTSTATPRTATGPEIHPVLAPALLDHPLVATRPHLYCGPRWLAVEEQAHQGQKFYVSVSDDDGRAFAPVYGFDGTSSAGPATRPDLFVAEATGGSTDPHVLLPSFTIGGRRPGHSRFHTGGPAWRRAALLTRLLGTAAEEAAHRGAAVLAALYCSPQDADLAHAFRHHGGVRLPSHGTNILGLPGDAYEAWLASLPRRQRAVETADADTIERAGIDFSVAPLRSTDIDWMLPLELSSSTRDADSCTAEEATALYGAYLDHLGHDAFVIRATREGRPVGFVSMIRQGSSAYVRHTGFDGDVSAAVPLRSTLTVQQPIRWAYTHGVTRLDLSVGADSAKQDRGAVTCARDAWFIPLDDSARAHLARTPRAAPA